MNSAKHWRAVVAAGSMMLLCSCSRPQSPAPTPMPSVTPIVVATVPVAPAVQTDTDRYLLLIRPYGPDTIASFTVSPDSRYVAIDARYTDSWTNVCGVACRIPAGDIYLFAIDTSAAIPLTADHAGIAPSWSPDGKRLAFMQRGSVWLYTLSTQRLDRLSALTAYLPDTPANEYDYAAFFPPPSPQWSPNGRAIAACASNGGFGWLVVAHADNGNRMYTTRHRGRAIGEVSSLRWNPDNSLTFVTGSGTIDVPFAAFANT